MGLIWNLVSLAKNAKQAVGTIQTVKGQADQCQGALQNVQQTLVQRDYEKAVAGNVQAQFEMGERFYKGLGVNIDYSKAAAWFQWAANQGHPNAQKMLSLIYYTGKGVNPDPAESYKWICLAARSGIQELLLLKSKLASKIPQGARIEGEKRASSFVPSTEAPKASQ